MQDKLTGLTPVRRLRRGGYRTDIYSERRPVFVRALPLTCRLRVHTPRFREIDAVGRARAACTPDLGACPLCTSSLRGGFHECMPHGVSHSTTVQSDSPWCAPSRRIHRSATAQLSAAIAARLPGYPSHCSFGHPPAEAVPCLNASLSLASSGCSVSSLGASTSRVLLVVPFGDSPPRLPSAVRSPCSAGPRLLRRLCSKATRRAPMCVLLRPAAASTVARNRRAAPS